MTEGSSLCKIAIFYDGSYVNRAQRFFFHERKVGWLDLQQLQQRIEHFVSREETSYSEHRVVYAAWFQGLFPASEAKEDQLRFDRRLHHDLMHAGIEAKFQPTSQSRKNEKGVDVALSIDAMQTALEAYMDVAVLVTGDGDYVPLVRALMKQGVRVMSVYFEFEGKDYPSFINERLRTACNYELDVARLESDKASMSDFQKLFKK